MPGADLAAQDLGSFGDTGSQLTEQGGVVKQTAEGIPPDPPAGGSMPEAQAMMAAIGAARQHLRTTMSGMGDGIATFGTVATQVGAKYIDTHAAAAHLMAGANPGGQ